MNWQSIAEEIAAARSTRIRDRVEAAVAEHAPYATVERGVESISVRARGLKTRWLSDPALRFARRTGI